MLLFIALESGLKLLADLSWFSIMFLEAYLRGDYIFEVRFIKNFKSEFLSPFYPYAELFCFAGGDMDFISKLDFCALLAGNLWDLYESMILTSSCVELLM